MRILQQHLDFIEYEPKAKEISLAEEAEKKVHRYEEIVVLFTSVEQGDDAGVAKKAIEGTRDYLGRLKVNRIIIYPYAHLSQNLARPKEALEVLRTMEAYAKEAGIETYRAPFGWNKAFQIKVKGHPLAEQSRLYSSAAAVVAQPQQPPPERVSTDRRVEMTEEQLLSRIKKSDFGGLPETDHRIIGERLDLFSFQEPSPGMVYWHDKGWTLRNTLVDFIRRELRARGYKEVSNPALANTNLWRVSGHSDHYRDNMFLTKLGEEEMGLKPMNCPSTFLVYRSRKWSFRDLPVRYAIFDPLYRNELSGVASGLFRVKILTQDDAHIIAREDQAEGEVSDLLDLLGKMYAAFKLEYRVKISTRPDETMGTDEEWARATKTLISVVEAKGLPYEIKEKEGNFYAPKIDVDIKDSLGREWQCGTVQLDLQMPKRFRLAYTGSDGKEHTPVVIHRTIYGSLERFIGILTEHYQGKFPTWLAPVQVRVLSLTDETVGYAAAVAKRLEGEGLRVESDLESATVGSKIRNAQLQKIPYMLVIGKKEEEAGTVAVRARDGDVKYGVKLEEFVANLKAEVAALA
ncbi:MAG: threonine--tRNA ligase [Nitrososphaerales archaeon]|jgi:threonyl-tRNA synthetase